MTTLKKRRSTEHRDQPAVTVYVTPTCVNCPKTLRVLRDYQVPHTVVDLSQDNTAYKHVTQELKYKQAPIVEVHHQHEIITWTGHHPEWIAEHILSIGPYLHFEIHTKGEQA